MKKNLHLNLFIHTRGHHEAAWRHPDSSKLPLTDIRYYTDLAQRAEAGLFDSIFQADQLSLRWDVKRAPRTWLEPITALAAIAGATVRIGLIATASTPYSEPFTLARPVASIDMISGGRAGWNIVTSWSAPAARNYGDDAQVSHADRYKRAEEFVAVTKALWDSWDDDAIQDNRATGEYIRQRARKQFYNSAVAKTFTEYDLLLTPSVSVAALPVGRLNPKGWPQHEWDWFSWAGFSYPFNFSGNPAATAPAGFTSEGLPVGLQIVGRRFADLTVLQAAAAFEEIQPWAGVIPPLQ